MEPVPPGIPGQLFIQGPGLASGYLHAPATTANAFVPIPLPKGIAYMQREIWFVGKLVKQKPSLRFLGRLDDQVKIRGFRIEVDEIKHVLQRHPLVGNCLIRLGQNSPDDKFLVAYVAPAKESDSGQPTEEIDEQLQQWAMVFDEQVYTDFEDFEDPTLNLSGWISSYDGDPIPQPEMEIWLADTIDKIMRSQPKSVLELGCGTGMLLFQVAPHSQHYLGCDISQVALDHVEAHCSRPDLEGVDVQLLKRSADQLATLPAATFDLLIVNSVAQYFPSLEYFYQVIQDSLACMTTQGVLFLGDIRHFPLFETLRTDIEWCRAQPETTVAALLQRRAEAMEEESELLVDPNFFYQLEQQIVRINHVEVMLKRGEVHNELTLFRYDACLYLDHIEPVAVNWQPWQGESLEDIATLLGDGNQILAIHNIPSLRLGKRMHLTQMLATQEADTTVAVLQTLLAGHKSLGCDPHQLFQLGDSLGMETRIYARRDDQHRCFDLVFLPVEWAKKPVSPAPSNRVDQPFSLHTLANKPLKSLRKRRILPMLKDYLQQQLPEYMVPSQFFFLEAFPKTPGGKVDLRALPNPSGKRAKSITPLSLPVAKLRNS